MVTVSKGGMPPQYVSRSEFIDINPKTLFFEEMNTLKQSAISTGWITSKGAVFKPLENVKRDAIVAFIYRALGSPSFTPPKLSPFKDVKTNNIFYKEITWAAANGITTGWKTSSGAYFKPLENVKRDAVAAFLFRATKGTKSYKPPTRSAFIDVKTNNIFYKEISWMSANGISTGWKTSKGATFEPFSNTKRDAMAAFIVRWAKIINRTSTVQIGNATYKIDSELASDITGSITFNSLVAKRFSVAPSVALLRDANAKGWETWLKNQTEMTENVDKAWLKTYSDKWLIMADKPAIEANDTVKAKWDKVGLTGVGQDAASKQREGMTVLRHIYSQRQVNEAWTMFWLDHFSVPYSDTGASQTLNIDLWMRDKALTSFPEILNAMMRTLKLWQFLDADKSKKDKVNENLSRELLELYTTGITTGIEPDIRQLATFLSGFEHSWDGKGNLTFYSQSHDNSLSTVKILGKTYNNKGLTNTNVWSIIDQLSHNLAWDERTIRFISNKIVSHFVKDNPTKAMVDAVVKTYKITGGDVKAIMKTMILHTDFTKNIGSKWRRPQEMLAAHQSNLGPQQNLAPFLSKHPNYIFYVPAEEYLKRLGLAGHFPRNNHSPKGYDNMAETWMNASSILHTLNALNESGTLAPKSYKTTKTFAQALGYKDGDYTNTAKKLVREVTGFTPDDKTVSIISKILSDKSKSWDDRINTAVSRAYSSPYGFMA